MRLHRWWSAGLVAWLALPASLAAQVPDAAALAESIQSEIVAAYVRGDNERLAAARALAERGVTAYPEDALLHHYLGFALYRTAAVAGDDSGSDQVLEAAEAALLRSAEIRPLPETHALLSSVYGLQIGRNPALGAVLGPGAGEQRGMADRLGPENPRVWLLKGIGAIYTPPAYGGGLDKAGEYLDRSLELFRTDEPEPPLPAWGKADVHVWRGQVFQQLGDTERARTEYAAALEIEPEYAWVTEDLLPALDGEAPVHDH